MAAAATGSRKPRAEINNMAHLQQQTTRNCLLLLVLALVSLCGASFHYEAPSDCQWTLMNSSVSLPSSSSSAAGGTLTSSGGGSTGHSSLPMVGGGGGVGGAGANDVALHCRLRTINSQFDQTNFSVVPREHTASLTIECSDSLLYQRYVLAWPIRLYKSLHRKLADFLIPTPPRDPIPLEIGKLGH